MNQRLLLLAAATLWSAPALAQQAAVPRDNINALIEAQAKAAGVPSSFVHQVVKRESNYNPKAKGGSALGLMQIKHATARGMGYGGDAAGLYDPETNLRYGIAYLAGAYRAAKGDIIQAYSYYSRGYYYAAKRLGISTSVAALDPAPAAKSGAAFGSLFGLRPATDPNLTAASTALAYAPSAATDPAPTEVVEVPLPPRRPAAFLVDVATASVASVPATAAAVSPEAAVVAGPATTADATIVETVAVPLPPRRPSLVQLASVGRPIVAKKPAAAAPVLEASALPSVQ
ncbi:lytic transglycosylase [Methylobacterium sp. Leaf399]|uniref:transglycosylase SLT domain-containing protein n=1 Tax=unclassified Methylobacterium TaxID=2615210 RepID=UPI0006F4B2F3|nr:MULTISPECIES: transglycosylase SLT domain-containing protein [unclassified Methylobacterium]KQP50762.1 lytic transglycosylase [Methylobacterium sp. Leaf108]KQT07742.1 lytic transglycosylase [Methylobacterium sp. Leaf399]KQT82139.1 lytic transglycosylase [Methylobacterium sp. Leaf466]